MRLKAVGLCGVDDSVHPNQLVMYSHLYPFVEFGVLFRPDKEGQPRYPSPEWVQLLSKTVLLRNKNNSKTNNSNSNNSKTKTKTKNTKMKLAAHLCERRVDQVLRGDDSFVQQLYEWGFGRVQINATAVNGVDTSIFFKKKEEETTTFVKDFLSVVHKHPELEFILQKNEETKPLWQGVLNEMIRIEMMEIEIETETEIGKTTQQKIAAFPKNISMLLDESKGTGVLPTSWPAPPTEYNYDIGYAGGIGPENITYVLEKVQDAVDAAAAAAAAAAAKAGGREEEKEEVEVWIDMESRLRSQKNGIDVFDLDKCYQVILAVCEYETGLLCSCFSHPSFLLEEEKDNNNKDNNKE